MKVSYSFRIQKELKQRLERIAEKQGISLNALLQIELRKFVEEYEKKEKA